MAPLRTVLDANIVISALIRTDSAPGRILRAAVEGTTVRMLTSEPLLAELRATLDYPRLQRYLKMSAQDREAFVTLLEQVADPVRIADHPAPGICRDPDDELYLQTALAGRADYVVSGDSDLLDLKAVEHIPIISPAEFERLLIELKKIH
ncbi:MAG: putative toxin-antitoxin system toxin component, PIN family [Kiritimatiellia bacterium]|nr:putative toxin-antitoxin system toxin component, PIN family [Kiritimatiellia bacterium]